MITRQRKLYHRALRAIRELSVLGEYTEEQREARAAMWGHRCYMCGAEATEMDHVKPIRAGGANWPCNLRPVCKECNAKKNAQWPWGRVWASTRHCGKIVREGWAWGPLPVGGAFYPEDYIWEAAA